MKKPGERGRIGLRIKDEGLRSQISFLLRTEAIEAEDISSMEGVEGLYKVVITDEKPRVERPGILVVKEGFQPKDLFKAIRVLERLPRRIDSLTIGVDPGEKIGSAALCSNELIDFHTSHEVSSLIQWIEWLLGLVKPPSVRVRVGRGDRWREIVEAVKEKGWEGVKVEVVDEKETTKGFSPWDGWDLGKDVRAAIRIALKV